MYEHLYVPEPNTGCWIWLASLNSMGRPRVSIPRPNGTTKTRMAYSVICESVKGALPEGLVCSHICHNILCVNPDHIVYETQRENLLRRDPAFICTGNVMRLKNGRWRARIGISGETRLHLGVFDTEAEAHAAIKSARAVLGYEIAKEAA